MGASEKMKIEKSHPVRKGIREMLSLAFWLHAAGLFGHLANLVPSTSLVYSRYVYNGSLIAFILYYSYLSDRGWFSVTYDLFYIYFWPFISVSRVCWLMSKKGVRYVRTQLKIPKLNLLVEQRIAAGTIATVAATTAEEKPEPSILHRLLRPLVGFPILWAILILTDREHISLGALSLIALFGAVKALVVLWNLRLDAMSWKSNFKAKLAEQLRSRIDHILAWQEEGEYKNLINELNCLKFYEAVFSFLEDNREFLNNCTTAIAIGITIPFYAYVSGLFSLAYFGISKIQGISWDWPSAFSVSLFMPFAYTDLPHSFPLRVLGGLQAVAVGFMSWSILSKRLTGHFEKVVEAAIDLRQPFVDRIYIDKVQRLTALHNSAAALPGKIPVRSVKIGGSRKKHLAPQTSKNH
jgi:hypothetical protein